MLELDSIISQGVARRDIPFAVAAVARGDGMLWQGAAGESSDGHPAGPETLFRLFSMTKAIGGLAAMILIDRGKLRLDTEVREVLPQFGKVQVLEAMGPDGPVLRPGRRPATLRHLLTHTSGLAVDAFDQKMRAFQLSTGLPHERWGTVHAMNSPLMFDPGDGWAYGNGTDWAGYMVQQVDGRPLDQFCREEIFEPLGMKNATFEADQVPVRQAQVYSRTPDGSFEPVQYQIPSHPEIYRMAAAMHATAPDYLQFLRLLLTDGEVDGYRMISPGAMRLMKENQMGAGRAIPILQACVDVTHPVDYLFDQTSMTHTACCLRTEHDILGKRAAGSLWWAGFLNTFYWADPANDVAAVLMTQSLPFCDPRFIQVWDEYERAVYRHIG
jgi:methyl acetate hydrolase